MPSQEINFDGLVGPTHNYAGLSHGNLASAKNKGKTANPKAAALQGLAKMKFLADLGIKQAILPPHPRPDLSALRRLGFTGTDRQILAKSAKESPALLAACTSASPMWTANAATVSPSADTADGRVHFTPANLLSQFHRSLETTTTAKILAQIFPGPTHFTHHAPLLSAWTLADEGAANHMRLCLDHDSPGVEVFTFGRDALAAADNPPRQFPARQTLQASQAVARNHQLAPGTLFARQNRAAIDAGAFHNDVVATANENLLLYHELAWENSPAVVAKIRKGLRSRGTELNAFCVTAKQVPLSDAIQSYLFNSQLITLPTGPTVMIAPQECRKVSSVRRFLDSLPIAVHFVPVRQSMRNGGGPACLRLRVVLTDEELNAVNPAVFLTPTLHDKLSKWIHRHYRDTLTPADLSDPHLLNESRRALDNLTTLLNLPSIYDFQ